MYGRIFWNDVNLNLLVFPFTSFSVGVLAGVIQTFCARKSRALRDALSIECDRQWDIAFNTCLVLFWLACYVYSFCASEHKGSTFLAMLIALPTSFLVFLYGGFFVFLPLMVAFLAGWFIGTLRL